jgi:two-component system, NtrC family, sensor kinase
MRYIIFFFILMVNAVFAQKSEALYIDNLSKEGNLLDEGWKWHVGDDTLWKNPDFNDSQWGTINPLTEVFKIEDLKTQGIGWMRLTLDIAPLYQGKTLNLVLNLHVAAEIYINGFLVEKIGFIGSNTEETQAVSAFNAHTIGLPYNSDTKQKIHIAIKVGYQESKFYTRIGFNRYTCIKPVLIESENTKLYNHYQQSQVHYSWFQSGIFFILTLLHLAFYLLLRSQKANLYLAIATLFLGVAFRSIAYSGIIAYLSNYFQSVFIETFSFSIAYIFLLRAIYEIYQKSIGIIFWLIVGASVLSVISLFTPYSLGSITVEMIAEIITTLEIIRITIIAVKENKPSAKPFLAVMIVSLIMFCIFYLDFVVSWIQFFNHYNILFYQVALISVPISISIYVAINFSRINKALVEKLLENEALNKQNFEQEQEKKQILAAQKDTLEQQVQERTLQLKQSLETLKLTQEQLIQKEKLASLGELTAGIAHEIQNPLNFVNNFSELSVDIVKDLKEELKKHDKDEKYIEELFDDLRQNQEKINHHGKRASNIVKGMLGHSRASTGVKELTDINKLVDEYLRLSYHGIRAKDKAFNADFKTEFEENLPKIEVIPQDMGRVLLNLINNAFYAVHQRHLQDSNYTPSVSVSTQYIDNQVIIKVIDNGPGMPESVKAKVFQPFFTTKPTGQGTGLGLSLAYDIVTKGHGGTLEVESTEGVATEFTVKLQIDL